MQQLINDLTNRLQKAVLDRAGGLLSREDIQEVVIASMETNVTFLRSEVAVPLLSKAEVERNLKFVAMRDILEAIVDRPELNLTTSEVVKIPEKGVFEQKKVLRVTVGILNLSPKPQLRPA